MNRSHRASGRRSERTSDGGSDGKGGEHRFRGHRFGRGARTGGRRADDGEGVKEAGDDALVIFDGAGTKWVAELSRGDHKYPRLFEDAREIVGGARSYCAGAYGVREQVERTGVELLEGDEGHPSVRSLVNDGYEVVTF